VTAARGIGSDITHFDSLALQPVQFRREGKPLAAFTGDNPTLWPLGLGAVTQSG
jgi:hypothetical protein